jgi:hypothetical protein
MRERRDSQPGAIPAGSPAARRKKRLATPPGSRYEPEPQDPARDDAPRKGRTWYTSLLLPLNAIVKL